MIQFIQMKQMECNMPEQMIVVDYKKFKQLEKDAYDFSPAEEREKGRIPARFTPFLDKSLVYGVPIKPEDMNKVTEEFNNGRLSQQEYDLFKFVFDQCNGKTSEQAKYIMQQMSIMIPPYELKLYVDDSQVYSAVLQRYNLFKEGKISGAEMDFYQMEQFIKDNDALYEDFMIRYFDYIWSDSRIDIIKDFYTDQSSGYRDQVFDARHVLKQFELWRHPKPEIIDHVVQRATKIVDKIIEQEIAKPAPNIERLSQFSALMIFVTVPIMRANKPSYDEIKKFEDTYSMKTIMKRVEQKIQERHDTIARIKTATDVLPQSVSRDTDAIRVDAPKQQDTIISGQWLPPRQQ